MVIDNAPSYELVLRLKNSGKHNEALKLMLSLVQRGNSDASELSLLSHLYILNNDLESAIATIERAKMIDGNSFSVHLNAARIAIAQNKHQDAITMSEKACSIEPKNAESLLVYGLALQATERIKEAIQAINLSVEIDPEYAEAYGNLAFLLTRIEEHDQAITNAKKATKIKPHLHQVWKLLGDLYLKSGQITYAIDSIRQAVDHSLNNEEYIAFLGDLFLKAGQFNNALKTTEQLLSINCRSATGYLIKGLALQSMGDIDSAKRSYLKSLEFNENLYVALNNLGAIYESQSNLERSAFYFEKALSLSPGNPTAALNLAIAYHKWGKCDSAISKYVLAQKLDPKNPLIYRNLGNILRSIGRNNEAVVCYKHYVDLDRSNAEIWTNLGNAQKDLGLLEDAEKSYKTSIAIDPKLAPAYSNLGVVQRMMGRLGEAKDSHMTAVKLRPDLPQLHSNLGNSLMDLGRLVEAKSAFNQAIKLDPNFAHAYNNLGNVQKDMGLIKDAKENFIRAIDLDPRDKIAINNLLFLVNYDCTAEAHEIYALYNKYCTEPYFSSQSFFKHVDYVLPKDRRIRIAYSSSDFRSHSCRFFLQPILQNHDRNKFEIFAYSNTERPDHITDFMRAFFDHWVDVRYMNDSEMANHIYNNKIDIVIDLAGHTLGNRLSALSLKPAPIQVSYLGCGYTTGLKQFDYFVGDSNLTPLGSDQLFSENIWRLSSPALCYQPPTNETPDVNDLPAYKNGYVTFGSLSRAIRFNDRLLKTWAVILHNVPNSRLRLDQVSFVDHSTKNYFFNRFERLGIPKDRVDLSHTSPHWRAYHDIDISLDCFPHNSGTTTFESLWMGVPVLSILDRPSVGRFGSCILKPLGLVDWLANDINEYVDKAVSFSSNLDQLARLRGTLRKRLELSPLMNSKLLTKELEAAFTMMLSSLGDKS